MKVFQHPDSTPYVTTSPLPMFYLQVMYLSILASMQELALLVVVMGAGVLLFGSALYIAEGFSTPDNEPLQFKSIPEAMWWAIITMTTVG